jgi:hypothetical protein
MKAILPKHQEYTMLILVSAVQLGVIFVMFFVQFKMFTIIPFFLIPMLILEVLTICLIAIVSCKLETLFIIL